MARDLSAAFERDARRAGAIVGWAWAAAGAAMLAAAGLELLRDGPPFWPLAHLAAFALVELAALAWWLAWRWLGRRAASRSVALWVALVAAPLVLGAAAVAYAGAMAAAVAGAHASKYFSASSPRSAWATTAEWSSLSRAASS